jgi:pimeloyl-ACP methyl ester carboxylesterase
LLPARLIAMTSTATSIDQGGPMRPVDTRSIIHAAAFAALVILTGCEIWAPPTPTDTEQSLGLIVMYPGDDGGSTEMIGFYTGLREAGVNQAIESTRWTLPWESSLARPAFWEKFPDWARQEAERIAAYQLAHPGAPITLLGYSGGCMAAIMVAAQMPEGSAVDRVLLLSPGVSPDYDLQPTLAKVRDRVIVYWSPKEVQLGGALLQVLGTVDGNYTQAAAFTGFNQTDPKLEQIEWSEEMAAFGNNGDHLDYFWNVPWIRQYVTQWIAQPAQPGQ